MMRPPPRCTPGQSVCTSCRQAATAAPLGGAVASSAKAVIATNPITATEQIALLSFIESLQCLVESGNRTQGCLRGNPPILEAVGVDLTSGWKVHRLPPSNAAPAEI